MDLIASQVVGGQPSFICGPCGNCCMYPWPNPLAALYPATDLPDKLLTGSIEVDGTFSAGYPTELTRTTELWTGSFFGLDWTDIVSYTFVAALEAGGYFVIAPTGEIDDFWPAVWLVCSVTVDGLGVASVIGIEGQQRCLVSMINDTDTFWRTDDEFVSSYVVNGATTINRVTNLPLKALTCRWVSASWQLKYNAKTFRWELNGVPKSSPQDGPVGTYGGNTVA